MSVDQSSGFCRYCQAQVMTTRKGTNHLLHFFITLLSCGWWAIVWILVSIKFGGWMCTRCGLKT